jgi:hypothetical protein
VSHQLHVQQRKERCTHPALATDSSVPILVGRLVQFKHLDTGADLEGRARIGAGGLIVLEKLNILEVVSPDVKGSSAG